MKIYENNPSISKIDNQRASAFIAKHHPNGVAINAEALSSYGLFRNEVLTGVAQFSLPEAKEMRKVYSTELLRLVLIKSEMIENDALALVDNFKKIANPTDIFTLVNNTQFSNAFYSKANFTLVSKSNGGSALKDEIYEWVNKAVTFYTYRITATDSEKYYYGVSSVKIKNATKADCEAANYFGSGGVKFRNWRKRHENELIKEVISTYPRKAQAYTAEEKLVAQLHFSDPLCLNSIKGGRRRIHEITNSQVYETKECELHGMTPFLGKSCSKCSVAKRTNLRECSIHGLQKHQGKACYKCIQEKVAVKKECVVHGHVSFLGDSCRFCIAEKSFKIASCSVHGNSPHHGKQCAKCQSGKRTHKSECQVHGITKFQGDSCYKCITNDRNTMRECSIHGYTKHSKDSCYKCTVASRYTERECSVHGLGKNTKKGCVRCSVSKNFSVKICPIHGETKHNGSTCSRCHAQSVHSKKL